MNKVVKLIMLLVCLSLGSIGQTLAQRTSPIIIPKFLGKHALTLQWLGWDHPGSVMIRSEKNGWYHISGQQVSQENSENYLKIEGQIRPISARELEFEGMIESKVDYINNNEPCIREGKQFFKATGTRKYWRLQNMTNCEGNAVDYIDIYFR